MGLKSDQPSQSKTSGAPAPRGRNPKRSPKAAAPAVDPSATSKAQEGERKQRATRSTERELGTEVEFPIVGIGASAGGLAAFEAFFTGLPRGRPCGIAFVLVQHLDPDHESMLVELVQRSTHLKVIAVEDGVRVEPDCVYVIPPNRDMALLNGTLHLMPSSEPRGQRMPINFFFQSLAQDLRERAIGIILSGTGSDGTLGARAIKAADGLVLAQATGSTEFDGMPGSVIAAGLVDDVQTPEVLGARIGRFTGMEPIGSRRQDVTGRALPSELAMKKILILLRAATGHDFSHYKAGNFKRRVERRMAMHQIDSVEGYVALLRQAPAEVTAIFRDLLITVTQFFRDPEAFTILEEQVIPAILAGKRPGSDIRVWTPGCSTGEEAYSIAMLLQERISAMQADLKIKVFATDIDRDGLAVARMGCYPALIAQDVGPERLRRFFTLQEDGRTYRLQEAIRGMVIFSEQNVIRDPPFSSLDLLSCRNLLIYLDADIQKRLIPLFHYSLRAGGFLFLGGAETIGDFGSLFAEVNRKHRLYRSKDPMLGPDLAGPPPIPTPGMPLRIPGKELTGAASLLPNRPPFRERVQQALLAHLSLVGALVDGNGDLLYLHGHGGQFLEPQQGYPAPSNLLKMARPGLRSELTRALKQVVAERTSIRLPNVEVVGQDGAARVHVTIRPMPAALAEPGEAALYLVILEEPCRVEPTEEGQDVVPPPPASALEARFEALQRELWAKEAHLQATNDELLGFNQAMQSAYEELQSMNEQLQGANQEQMTAKEELQSANEELATVNTELQVKVNDLSRLNNDMNNLLAGTNIATIFVDPHLRILRFTPAALSLVNLLATDFGRPLTHFATNILGYDHLVSDTQEVLDTLGSKDAEVQAAGGRWYTMRIQPYRTQEQVVQGAVITFVDTTEEHKSREMLEETRNRLKVIQDGQVALCVFDLAGRILVWNAAAARLYGWSETEALAKTIHERMPEAESEAEWTDMLHLKEPGAVMLRSGHRFGRDGRPLEVSILLFPVCDAEGKRYATACLEWPRNASGSSPVQESR